MKNTENDHVTDPEGAEMAKLIAATITGLAGRKEEVKISFEPDLNVFWGMNGSGKTSFLRILHSALTGDASSILRTPFKTAEVIFESEKGKRFTRRVSKAARISDLTEDESEYWELLQEDGVSDAERERFLVEASVKWQWRTTPELLQPRLRRFDHGYLPISRMTDLARHFPTGRREPTGLLNEALIDQEFARQTSALWREYSNTALVTIRQAQEEGLAEVLSAILLGERQGSSRRVKPKISSKAAFDLVTSFFRGQRIAPQLTSYEKFAENYENNSLLRDVVSRISEIQHSITVAQAPQQRLVEMFELLFPNKRLVLDSRQGVGVHIGKERIPLESLSSGEKQIVRLLLECLAARGNAIIIDEPELSLHVDWQHRLVSFMRLINPDAQIILATHSPEVMAEVPLHQVFEL